MHACMQRQAGKQISRQTEKLFGEAEDEFPCMSATGGCHNLTNSQIRRSRHTRQVAVATIVARSCRLHGDREHTKSKASAFSDSLAPHSVHTQDQVQ